MDIDLIRSAEQFHNRYRRNRIVRKLVSILACVVVFSTTYALILPAITMERETLCGLAEHQHTESCYTRKDVRHLACGSQSLGIHTHTAQCADGSCGYADFVIHEHNSSCYEDGKLVCPLPEVKAHTHTDDCYRVPTWEESGHTHTDECYTMTKGLSCGKTETEGHTHTDACRSQKQVLSCDTPESDGHHHGEGCYDENDSLTCTTPESSGHHHDASCYRTEETMTCGKEESEPHQHTDACYAEEKTLICTEKEGPVVKQGAPELACTMPEIAVHEHSAACFDADNKWICGKLQILSHAHTDACFATAAGDVLTCELEVHEHTEECYAAQVAAVYGVRLMSNDAEAETTSVERKDLTTYITNVDTSFNSDKYPAYDGKNTVTVGFHMTFKLTQDQIRVDNQLVPFTYTLPENLAISDSLLSTETEEKTYTGTDTGGENAFQYRFYKTDDGRYLITIDFIDSYVESHDNFNGYLNYNATADANLWMEDGTESFTFKDGVVVTIPSSQLKTEDGGTFHYDLSVGKSNSGYDVESGKITYSVTVDSNKGTPNPLTLTDILTATGLEINRVELGGVTVADKDQYGNAGTGSPIPLTGDDAFSYDTTTKEIHMSLPGLSVGTSGTGQKYTITYDVYLNEPTEGTVYDINNSATVIGRDNTYGEEVRGSAQTSITIDKSLKVEKTGFYDAATDLVSWTITVNGNGVNVAGAELSDSMFDKIKAEEVEVQPSGGYTIVQNNDGTIQKITFSATDSGTNTNTNTYAITYSAPSGIAENGSGNVSNTATLDPNPNVGGDEKTVTPNVWVDRNTLKTLNKSNGSYDSAKQEIVWTILVNDNKAGDVANFVLTDDMFDQMVDGSLTIEKNWNSIDINNAEIGLTITKDDAGKIISIKFLPGTDGTNNNYYKLTYRTPAVPSFNDVYVTNTATITRPDRPDIQDYDTVTVTSNANINKVSQGATQLDNGNIIITWKSEMTVPSSGLPEGTVLTDTLHDDQWMTWDQIQLWGNEIVGGTNANWLQGQGNNSLTFYDADGKAYAYDEIAVNAEYQNKQFVKYQICFPNGISADEYGAKTIWFTYASYAPVKEGVSVQEFENTVSVKLPDGSEKTKDATYTYRTSSVLKTDGNGTPGESNVTTSDGTLTWKVQVQPGKNCSTVTLTDNLPAGVSLSTLTFANQQLTLQEGSITGTVDGLEINGSVAEADGHQTVTLTAALPEGVLAPEYFTERGVFYVVYTCKVSDDRMENAKASANHTVGEFTNTVTLKVDNVELASSSQTQNVTYEKPVSGKGPVTKSGGWVNDTRRLEYSILLNPDENDLIPGEGNDTLTLTDTLSLYIGNPNTRFDVSLLPGTVKLYYAVQDESGKWVKGTELSGGWSWRVDTQTENDMFKSTITATIPDETALLLEYAYYAWVPEGSSFDNGESTYYGLYNEAKLTGVTNVTGSSRFDVAWKTVQHGAGIIADRAYVFYKVKTGDYGTRLPGAEFKLYDASGQDLKKTYTTDANGSFTIQWNPVGTDEYKFSYNTVYYVQEDRAPTGYLKPEDAPKYYFYFSNAEDTEHALPATLPEGAVDLSKTAQTVYVENEVDDTPRYELPETGGIGTQAYTLGGLTMAAGAVLWLCYRRKRRREGG